MPGTAEFQKIIDTDKENEGVQLPDNFADTFKDKASRQTIVDAAQDKFTNIDEANKTAIIDKAAAEIKSWTKKPEATDKDYNSKIAVLYLYTLLKDPTKDHTSNQKTVLKNYDSLKAETVTDVPVVTEAPATETTVPVITWSEVVTDLWNQNITLTEEEIMHYDTNSAYAAKLETLWTSRNNKKITLDDYQWTITSIDWHLIIAISLWSSVSIPIKEISQDKITLNWQGNGADRIIYNHWDYVDNIFPLQ